jgi:hypothetical protein
MTLFSFMVMAVPTPARREAEPLVEAVGIACAEQDTTQTLQGGVAHDALDQPFRQPLPPVRLQHEHVAKPGERGPVGHDAGEADLSPPFVQPEAERVVEGTAGHFERSARRPIRAVRQETVDQRHVEEAGVRRDEEVALSSDLVRFAGRSCQAG